MDKSYAVLIDQSDSSKCRSSPTEGVAFNNQLINQSLEVNLLSSYNISSLEGVKSCSQSISQSQARMQNRDIAFSPREVDSSCSSPLDHSQPSMQIRYVKPEVCEGNHCLRPYISKSSYIMDASNNLAQNSALNSTLITLILLLILLISQIIHLNNQISSASLKMFLQIPLIFVPQVNKDAVSQQLTP